MPHELLKIYALSDQHGYLDFQLPQDANLILHAGDVCPDFFPRTPYGATLQEHWLQRKWLPWCAGVPIYATFGNHDFVRKQDAPTCFRVDEVQRIARFSYTKNHTKTSVEDLTVWFSPWSNEFCGWAWMQPAARLQAVYDAIPKGIDILVSHQPPFGYGDQVPANLRLAGEDSNGHVGSKELLATINRVRPRAVICGHIHSGFGQYQHVLPCLTGPDCGHAETTIYNCSLVNEQYQRVNPITEIILS